jgi:hypothetical protein
MNDDSSTYELPEYIHSRLQPQIFIDFPRQEEEYFILKQNLPYADDIVLNYVVNFLQRAHLAQEAYTVRDGINIARFALKLLNQIHHRDSDSRVAEGSLGIPLTVAGRIPEETALLKAIDMIMGKDARRYFQATE